MKKKFLLIALGASLVASEMPPMPPGFFDVGVGATNAKVKEVEVREVKHGKEEVKKVKRNIFPKECDPIPPMLYNFPPPMKADMDKCTAKLNEPSSELLVKQLSVVESASVDVISVQESEDFKGVYEVKYKLSDIKKDSKFKVLNDKKLNEKVIYSNSKATKFFTNKPIEVK